MTTMIEPVLELGNFDRCWSLGRYEIGEILWSIVREIPLGDSSVVIYIYIYTVYTGCPWRSGKERIKVARDCLKGVATDYLTDNQLYVPVGKADAVYIRRTG